MKTLILIITFIISLTGLLFKTTEDGKNGIKKISKWGMLLLFLMIIAFTINYIASNKEEIKTEIKIREQKETDSIRNSENEIRWKSAAIENQVIINRLKADSISSSSIKDLQLQNMNLQYKNNDYLKQKVSLLQENLSNLLFPIDTLFLSFEIILKIRDETKIQFYKELLTGDSEKIWDEVNCYKYIFEKDKPLYTMISENLFIIDLRSKQASLSFEFSYSDVPKLLDDSYSFSLGHPSRGRTTYSVINFNPYTNEISILGNRIKSTEINCNVNSNLRSICESSCQFTMTTNPSDDFDFEVKQVVLSDLKGSRHVRFYDFKQVSIDNLYFAYGWKCLKPFSCNFN